MDLFEKEEYGFGNQILTESEFSLMESFVYFPIPNYPQRSAHGYISICMAGEADLEINMVCQKVIKHKLVIIFPDQIVSMQNVSSDFSFLYIRLSPKFMSEILFRFPPAFVGFIKENSTHLMEEKEFEKFYSYYFSSLKFHYEDNDNLFRREIIINILRNFFLDTCDKIKKTNPWNAHPEHVNQR